MFIRNPHGSEAIQALAAQVGMVFGIASGRFDSYGLPALGGNTYAHKDGLKAAGARFDGENKVWSFQSEQAAEQALLSIINA